MTHLAQFGGFAFSFGFSNFLTHFPPCLRTFAFKYLTKFVCSLKYFLMAVDNIKKIKQYELWCEHKAIVHSRRYCLFKINQ